MARGYGMCDSQSLAYITTVRGYGHKRGISRGGGL